MALKNFLVLDFETHWDREGYSLSKLSVPEYIFHPKFQVQLLAAYDPKWRNPKIILPPDIPAFLKTYPPEVTAAAAHNMLFDGAILAWKYNWVPAQLIDTLGLVRALRQFRSYSLGAVAKELSLGMEKTDVLHKTRGLTINGIKAAGLWDEFCTYAKIDARLCLAICRKLWKEFPAEEAHIMDLVLRAALLPVLHADVGLLRRHLEELRARKAQLLADCGYEKASLMSTAQFQQALEELGVEIKTKTSPTGRIIPAFAKTDEFMQGLCEYHESYSDEMNFKVQALANARLAHKSTIEETRCEKFINISTLPWGAGNLLPIPLRYGGAHTHRLSGEWGLNMQNLPRDKEKSQLRSAIIAPPGYKIITADLAQIECRILAKLANQEDLLNQFKNNEDVYASFGTRIFRRTITKGGTPNERWIAKTAVLGLGYGCGAERFYKMVLASARQFKIPLDELAFSPSMAKRIVDTYRHTFSQIPGVWWALDNFLHRFSGSKLREAVQFGPVWLSSADDPNFLQIQLPIGNRLASLYLRYKGVQDPNKEEKYIIIKDLYGAKLAENIVQALARIVVMEAALRLNARGYRFVAQAHDELVFVILEDRVMQAKQIITQEMTRIPKWMPGLPLAVEIGVGDNYGNCKHG